MISLANPAAMANTMANSNNDQAACHDQFLALLPAISSHTHGAFRYKDAEAREEAVNATVAHAWAAFVRLFELGRAELAYAGPLAAYAIARVREGRSIGNRLNGRDVTSIRCQRRHGVQIESLNQVDGQGDWRELVVQDRKASPAEIAITRLDFAAWLETLSGRDRHVAEILATGESTRLAARRLGLTSGRISQLRRRLYLLWQQFQGEVAAVSRPQPA